MVPYSPARCMHDPGFAPVPAEEARLAPGTAVTGTVVCRHVYGVGLKLDGRDEYGHIDVIHLPGASRAEVEHARSEATRLTAFVVGYHPDQLRLTCRREDDPPLRRPPSSSSPAVG